MTGGRAERRPWNENGTAWTTWRQNVSRGSIVQRIQARDAIQMALFSLSWSVHSMSQCVDHWLGVRGEGVRRGFGGGGGVRLLFSFQAVIFRLLLWQDNGRWECIDIRRGPLPARTRRAKFNSVTAPSLTPSSLCNVCVGFSFLKLLSNPYKYWKRVPACASICFSKDLQGLF